MKLSPKSFISAIGLSAASLFATACVENDNPPALTQNKQFTLEEYVAQLQIPRGFHPQIKKILTDLDPSIRELNKVEQIKAFERILYTYLRSQYVLHSHQFVQDLKASTNPALCEPRIQEQITRLFEPNITNIPVFSQLSLEFPEERKQILAHANKALAYISLINKLKQRLDGS